MRVRRTLIAMAAISAVLTAALSGAPAQAAPAPKTAKIEISVAAPAGVAVTIAFKKNGTKVRTALAKKSTAKSATSKVNATAGRWTLSAPTVTVKGVLYGPKHSSSKVTVKAGKSQHLKVRYVAIAGPRNVKVTQLSSSKVQLSWTGSTSKKVRYVVRRATGANPPNSRTQGTAVAVGTRNATASKLKPNTQYAFAVFQKIGSKWTTPATVLVHTAPTPGQAGAAYVPTAGTTILAVGSAAANTAVLSGTGVTVALPAGTALPAIGSAVVVPATTALIGGFVGSVASISSTGVATLKAAPLSAAFSTLDIEVPSFSSLQPAATSDGSSPDLLPSSPSHNSNDANHKCSANIGTADITLTNTLTPSMAGSASIRLDGIAAIIDASVTVSATDSFTAGATGSVGGTCNLGTKGFYQQITAAPVPIGLKYEAGVSAKLTFDAAATVTSVRTYSNTYTLTSAIAVGGGITGDVKHTQAASSDAPKSDRNAQAHIDLSVEGSLTFGPAVGTDFAGAIAGVDFDLTPLRLAASVAFAEGNPAACWSLDLQWELKAGINAEVWAGWAKASFKTTLLEASGSYLPKPLELPTGCTAALTAPGGPTTPQDPVTSTPPPDTGTPPVTTTGDMFPVAGLAGPTSSTTAIPGPALESPLSTPQGIVFDSKDNLYVADAGHRQVDRITPSGQLSIFAGTGQYGTTTAGPALNTAFGQPSSLAVDRSDNLYVGEVQGGTVDKITSDRTLSIAARASQSLQVSGVAVDSLGNIYFSEPYGQAWAGTNLVFKVTPSGEQSVFAGNSEWDEPRPGPATESPLKVPASIAIDRFGNTFVALSFGNEVVKIDSVGTLSIVAGNGTTGFPVAGAATASPMYGASALATDAAGNVYIAGGNNITMVTPAGQLSLVAGKPYPQCEEPGDYSCLDGVVFTATRGNPLNSVINPQGLAIDSAGDLYFSDGGTNQIWKIPLKH